MIKSNEIHVLPRPVEALPEYASSSARNTLAGRLVEAFGLTERSARAIANAVVDPSAVRRSLGGDQSSPNAERIAVPGGTLLGLRTTVWSRRVMPDPRNPRTLPSRRHPFAVDPGTGAEDSKFRPVPEPRSPQDASPTAAELVVDIESRHHLNWASQHVAGYVSYHNDWSDSIRHQGVMEAVWVVPTTYRHTDGSDPATALTTAEGSSRITAVHAILGERSADVPYEDAGPKFRGRIKKLNDALLLGPNQDDIVALRCERVPALVIVGFEPYEKSATAFPTALKSLVALRHVDPPTPWGEGPENEALADEVLDELARRSLISETEAAYYAGSCTKAEAKAAHLSDDPAVRAAAIVGLLTNPDPRFREAVRIAVTSQSTRKRINQRLLNDLATALALRAVAGEPTKVDQARRYMRHAFGKSVHGGQWVATTRTTEQLVQDAMAEVRASIAAGTVDEPGKSSLELAVRAAFPLVVDGRLNADRGTSGNDQPDRRTPGEVLDAMRQSPQGIHQLGQALRDYAQGLPIRAVDEDGALRHLEGGEGEMALNDVFLRGEFPPPGKSKARRPGDTAIDRYDNAVGEFADAVAKMNQAFDALGRVEADDGRAMVDVKGVDQRACSAWRGILSNIDEELVVWSRTHKRVNGTAAATVTERREAIAGVDVQDNDPTAGWESDEDEAA
ncbi:hypothetical protein [Aureimonas sp. SK2]|uniref:hypothetical protein n=1 Tax=Aureimonas sp. SK2 TaxID=3015992 RepID=UPI0024439616|nr:hypothetical protein [Aureimonas sp. SK2]